MGIIRMKFRRINQMQCIDKVANNKIIIYEVMASEIETKYWKADKQKLEKLFIKRAIYQPHFEN